MFAVRVSSTNIPHDSLKNNLQELIAEAYRVREAKYLCFNKLGVAYWSAVDTTRGGVSEGELLEWLEFLIDNVYIQVGNKVFRQRIGILMGASLLANLFLFYYEYKYMQHIISSNLRLAKKFSNTVKYIDDLLTLNNSNFANEIPNIYPPELVLKRTTESPAELSYLDVSIRINSNRFITTLYDKRPFKFFYS